MAANTTEPRTSGETESPGAGRSSRAAEEVAAGGSSGDGTAGHSSDAPPADAGNSAVGFFGWIRSLGLYRQTGWIGGVAGGVAARLGIDPIIVRGVLVVFALFGAPAFLVYGLAWLLLPDATGRIHLEQLLRGQFDGALVGVAAFLLIGLYPAAFGGWFGSTFWPSPVGALGINPWPLVWTIVLVGAGVAIVVWIVRRVRATAAEPDAATRSDPVSVTDATEPVLPVGPAEPFGPAEPVEPPTAPVGADPDALAAWKQQHDAWRAEHAAWKRSQAESDRAVRARLAAENKARAVEFAAEADEARRRRRLERPRASFAFVLTVLGAAAVSGALAALTALSSGAHREWAVPIGLATATVIAALGMIVAGALRRRSGFLAAVTVVLLVGSLGSAAIPRGHELMLGSQAFHLVESRTILQPFGSTQVAVRAWGATSSSSPPTLDLTQVSGSVSIDVFDGARVRIVADFTNGAWSSVSRIDPQGTLARPQVRDSLQTRPTVNGLRVAGEVGRGLVEGEVDAIVRVNAYNGGVAVTVYEENQ